MGAFLTQLWARLTEFPIKNKPICFHLQKNFTTTGEKKEDDGQIQTDAYDELQKAFIRKLTEVGDKRDNWLRENFTHWDQITVDALSNNFMLLASEEHGMMDFKRFCWFLDSVADSSSMHYREEKFKSIDSNEDGYINVDEFLLLVYQYHSPNDMEELRGVGKTCLDTAQQIRNVTLLSIGEQLQHGLF